MSSQIQTAWGIFQDDKGYDAYLMKFLFISVSSLLMITVTKKMKKIML